MLAFITDRSIKTAKTQTVFGGYEHIPGGAEGSIYEMQNLSSRLYPRVSPRKKRLSFLTLSAPHGICAAGGLMHTDGNGVYFNGSLVGTVEASDKSFCTLGSRTVIFPDKKYYNGESEEYGSLEASRTGAVNFQNGALFGEAANGNTIYAAGVDFSQYFSVGDGVTVSGCVTLTANNKTAVVREIYGSYLRFSENCFAVGGEAAVTLARTVPDMDYICACENRLFGCKGDTIYASKLGDIFNWNVFDGISTDSWSATVGSPGNFTGCVSYLGYPIFFKDDGIYKLYGSKPSNFEIIASATLGVAEGSGKSLAVAGETLYYLSRAGVVAYTGGTPSVISSKLGGKFKNAVAGSDGVKLYISMKDENNAPSLFVLDTRRALWHREDTLEAKYICQTGDCVYAQTAGGVVIVSEPQTPPTGATEEAGETESVCEFARFYRETTAKKSFSGIRLRLKVSAGARVSVYTATDNDEYTLRTTLLAASEKTTVLPLVLRRCDSYRVKITASGEYELLAMTSY